MQARGYCLGIIPMQKSRKMGILGQNLRVVSYFHYHHHLLQGKMQSKISKISILTFNATKLIKQCLVAMVYTHHPQGTSKPAIFAVEGRIWYVGFPKAKELYDGLRIKLGTFRWTIITTTYCIFQMLCTIMVLSNF